MQREKKCDKPAARVGGTRHTGGPAAPAAPQCPEGAEGVKGQRSAKGHCQRNFYLLDFITCFNYLNNSVWSAIRSFIELWVIYFIAYF